MEVVGLACVSFWLASLVMLAWRILRQVQAQRAELVRLRLAVVKLAEALAKE